MKRKEIIVSWYEGKYHSGFGEADIVQVLDESLDGEFMAYGLQTFEGQKLKHHYCPMADDIQAQSLCVSFDQCPSSKWCVHFDMNSLLCDDQKVRSLINED